MGKPLENGDVMGINPTVSGWWFGTMEFYDFPYVGNNHPNRLSYFSEGLKPPTSDLLNSYGLILIYQDLPMKKNVIFHTYVSLPEGDPVGWVRTNPLVFWHRIIYLPAKNLSFFVGI